MYYNALVGVAAMGWGRNADTPVLGPGEWHDCDDGHELVKWFGLPESSCWVCEGKDV